MYSKRKIATLCSQLKVLLSSGMPLLEALKIIQGMGVYQLASIIDKISNGHALSEASIGSLPPLAIGSLRAAERAGNLEETLETLSKFYESKADLEEKIKGALVYPCFILILCLLSVLTLIVFVLPNINGMLGEFGVELPVITRVVFGTGSIISRYYLIFFFMIILISFFSFRGWRLNQARAEQIALKVPLAGKLIRQELVIQGLGTLGALLNGGAPIMEALEITANSSRSAIFKDIILKIRDQVENGGKLSEAFSESGFFPGEAVQMLKVGENSGRLGEMLLSVADFQGREREVFLKRFTTLLEPAMTLIVGAVVGFVVIAMFLPMVNMISKLQ